MAGYLWLIGRARLARRFSSALGLLPALLFVVAAAADPAGDGLEPGAAPPASPTTTTAAQESNPPARDGQEKDGATKGEAKKDKSADGQPVKAAYTDNVVVTATRSARPADQSPLSTTVIPQPDIKAAPALTLDDLLRSDPTINLPLGNSVTQSPTVNLLSMRGLGGNRTLVLLDGVPINDPFYGYIQWNKVPPGEVGNVEITRGAGSSLFGNYSLGGTINISTRPASASSTAVNVMYGSNNTRQAAVWLAEPVTETLALGLGFNFFDTDGYYITPPEERGPADAPSSARDVNVQGRADFQVSAHTRAYARLDYLDDQQTVGTQLNRSWRQFYDFAAGSHTATGAGGDLAATFFYQDQNFTNDSTRFVPGSNNTQEYLANRHNTPVHDLGGSVQWGRRRAGALTFFTFGVDLRRIEGEDLGLNYNSAGQLTLTQTAGGEQRSAGVFGEVSIVPLQRLEILLSARLDYWRNVDGHDVKTPGGATHFPDESATQFDPRLALRHEVSRQVALRGAVYRAFRAPTLNELYRTLTTKSLEVRPNPQLGPETLTGGDVGVDFRGGAWGGQFNLFVNDVRGLISRWPISTTPTRVYQLVNVGSTRSQGLELMANLALGPRWSVEGGYSHTNAWIVSNPQDPSLEGRYVQDIPGDVETLALRRRVERGLELTLRGRRLGRRYIDASNTLALDASTVVDLFISHPLSRQFEVFVMGTNIFDEVYLVNVRTGPQLGAPRQVFAGLRLRLAPGLFVRAGGEAP